jgi:hypothetical protein
MIGYKIAIPAIFVLIVLAFFVVMFGFTDSAEARYLENEHFCMTDSDCHFVPGCCAEPKAANIYHEYESSILCKAVCPDAAFSVPQNRVTRCIENQCVAVDV